MACSGARTASTAQCPSLTRGKMGFWKTFATPPTAFKLRRLRHDENIESPTYFPWPLCIPPLLYWTLLTKFGFWYLWLGFCVSP